ncbi:MAG: cell wall-binding repeat-containing protein, partial [Gracilibacteraceae bacterium]|nr:cell wall-binding repeat-containing protein [Gracilibacteraceae bacterium]
MLKLKKTATLWGIIVVLAVLLPLQLMAAEAAPNRLSGGDRYLTAVSISQAGWPSARNAVLASGADASLVDALTVAPLAKLLNAPILLTQGTALTPATAAELKRLDVETVYVSSGAGVIRQPVLDAVRAMGIEVVPLGGADRFATAANIAAEIAKRAEVTTVVVTTAYSNADALSVASIAAASGWPILLTGRDALPASAQNFIAAHNINNTYVIGGSGVISETLRERLPNSIRLGGVDRYGTNSVIITYFMTYWKYMRGIYVANGANDHLVDALAASSYIAGSPLILTDNRALAPDMRQFISSMLSSNYEIKSVIALGGETVTSDAILQQVITALAVPPVVLTGGGGGSGGGGKTNANGAPALNRLMITGPDTATVWTSKAVSDLTDGLVAETYLSDALAKEEIGYDLTSDASGKAHHLALRSSIPATHWLEIRPAADAPLDQQETVRERYVPDYAAVVTAPEDIQAEIDKGKTIVTVDGPQELSDGFSLRPRTSPVTVNFTGPVNAAGAADFGQGVSVNAWRDFRADGQVTVAGELNAKTALSVGGALTVSGVLTAEGETTVAGNLNVSGAASLGGTNILSGGALRVNGTGRIAAKGAVNTQPGSVLDIAAGGEVTVEKGGALNVAAGTGGDLEGLLTVRSGGAFSDGGFNQSGGIYGWAWPENTPSANPGAAIVIEPDAAWSDGARGISAALCLTDGELIIRRNDLTIDGAAEAEKNLTIPDQITLKIKSAGILTVAGGQTLTGTIAPEKNARIILENGAAVVNPALSNGSGAKTVYLFSAGSWVALSTEAAGIVEAFGASAGLNYAVTGGDITKIVIDAETVTLRAECDISPADLEITNGGALIVPPGRMLTTVALAVSPSAALTVDGSLTAGTITLHGTARIGGTAQTTRIDALGNAALHVDASGRLSGETIYITSGVSGAVNGEISVGSRIENHSSVWPWEGRAAGSVAVSDKAEAYHGNEQLTGSGGYLVSSPGGVITLRRDGITIGGTARLAKSLSLPAGIGLTVGADSTLVMEDNCDISLATGALSGNGGANLKLGDGSNVGNYGNLAPNTMYFHDGSNWRAITAGPYSHYFPALGYDGVSYTQDEFFITGEARMTQPLTLDAPLLIKEKGHLTIESDLTVGSALSGSRGGLTVNGRLTLEAGTSLEVFAEGFRVEIRGTLEAEGSIKGHAVLAIRDGGLIDNLNADPLDFWGDADIAAAIDSGGKYAENGMEIIGGREPVVQLQYGAKTVLTRGAWALSSGTAAVNPEKTFDWPAELLVADQAVLRISGTVVRNADTVADGLI